VIDAILPQWPAPANVRALTTTRRGPGQSAAPFDALNLGARVGDDPQAVARNRAALVAAFELPDAPHWLHQVHGTRVVRVDAGQDSSSEPEADAAVTTERGRVLAVQTADCLPLLLCAEDGSEVAAIHAGWRGLHAGVIEAGVQLVRAPAARLIAWLGPAIGPDAYEVGDAVRDAFVAVQREARTAFRSTRPGHWQCNLYALARQRLTRLGIERVFGGECCTYSDPERFYSYRRDTQTGRMASLIWIV
jgi:hypothetical protein